MIECALIGYGYWGRNVAKALHDSPHFHLTTIFDNDKQAQDEALQSYAFTPYANYELILADSHIQAVFIITPPHTHFALAESALKQGKHTFVEKPLTTQSTQAKILYDLADSHNVKLYCDHIFCTPRQCNTSKNI